MIRVLHATLSFEPGGRREAIRTLALNQQSLGVRSALCCTRNLGCDEALATGIFDRHVVLGQRGVFDRRAVAKLVRFCDEQGISVIHAHDAASQAVAALVRFRRPRIRALMTFHRSLGFESARAADRLRNALATAMCGAVVCGSRERRAHFLHENWVKRRKVVRIPFGIDLARFKTDSQVRRQVRGELGIKDDEFLFGAVGHFGNEKGIDIALGGFGRLLSILPPDAAVRFVVLGDGQPEQRSAIEKLATTIGRGRVTLAGFRRDAERWFNAMDAFVHVPRQEAFGLVLAEAMATGLPVVASKVGGIPDLVRPEVNGLLVAAEDIPELAAAMRKVYEDQGLHARLSAAAQQIAANEYGSGRYAADYLRLYEDLLAGRQPRGVDEIPVSDGATVATVPRELKSASMVS